MNCFWLHEGVAPNRIVNLQALRDFIATQQALEEPDVIQTHPASEDELCSAWEAFQSHRRREALILSPLQPGTVLSWSGSSLFPSVTDSAIDAGEARQPTTTEDPDRQSTGQATGQQAIEQMNKRICVPLLRRGNDDQVGPPSDTSIRLSGVLGVLPFVRPIFKYSYEGDNLYGFSTNRMQVWVGEVYQEGRNMGQKVVLKLYDERVLAPKMKGAALGTGERSDAYGMEDGYTLAWNEAAAYSKMSPLQGSIVPYSYGHYYFDLPDCTEKCVGMVQEYVEGENISTAVYSAFKKDGDRAWPLAEEKARLALECFKAVHTAGVECPDLDLFSIKMCMKVRCLVLLGFSLSKPCDPRLSRMPYGPIASAIMAAYEHDEELLQPLEVIDAIFRTAEGGQ